MSDWHQSEDHAERAERLLAHGRGPEAEQEIRRAIEIDRKLFEHDLPRGDETEAGETRGWFSHWRRGVGPTLRGWAKGSLGAVVHMLAVSARKFEVVDELGGLVCRLKFGPWYSAICT